MWIKIIPNDTLFFRSGRPFTMGDDTWADIVFPPYPSTIYGALRTFFIFSRGLLKDFKEGKHRDDIGTPEEKGKMRIIGPILSNINDNTCYFPVPLDCVKKKEEKKNDAHQLSRIKKPSVFYSNNKLEEILIYKPKDQVEEINGFFDDITLKDYLQGKASNLQYTTKENFYTEELKIGISRKPTTLTSKEGHLYRIPMIRMAKNRCLLIGIDNMTNIPDEGLSQLGGEGKTVQLRKANDNPLEMIINMVPQLKNAIFKLYLATPAIFEKGWLPGWIDESTFEGEKDGVKIKLIAAVIGKHLRIGGWDMAKARPKPMFKAVPAGSVYYFKLLDNSDVGRIKDVFHFNNISDINSEEGFGLSFIGEVS